MSTTTLKSLVEKLNSTSRQSLEAATARCQSRSHYSVETEHWLDAMLEQGDGDLQLLLRSFGINTDTVKQQLQQALEQAPVPAATEVEVELVVRESTSAPAPRA